MLYERLKEEDFSLQSIKLVKVDLAEMTISSPTPSAQLRVREKFLSLITKTWQDITGEVVAVKVIRRDAALVAKVVDDGILIKPPPKFRKGATAVIPLPPNKPALPAVTKKEVTAAVATLNAESTMAVVVETVKNFFNLPIDLREKRTASRLMEYEARLIAVCLCRLYLGDRNNTKIGKYFGGVGGISVKNMLNRTSKLMRLEPQFKQNFEKISALLIKRLGPPEKLG